MLSAQPRVFRLQNDAVKGKDVRLTSSLVSVRNGLQGSILFPTQVSHGGRCGMFLPDSGSGRLLDEIPGTEEAARQPAKTVAIKTGVFGRETLTDAPFWTNQFARVLNSARPPTSREPGPPLRVSLASVGPAAACPPVPPGEGARAGSGSRDPRPLETREAWEGLKGPAPRGTEERGEPSVGQSPPPTPQNSHPVNLELGVSECPSFSRLTNIPWRGGTPCVHRPKPSSCIRR